MLNYLLYMMHFTGGACLKFRILGPVPKWLNQNTV